MSRKLAGMTVEQNQTTTVMTTRWSYVFGIIRTHCGTRLLTCCVGPWPRWRCWWWRAWFWNWPACRTDLTRYISSTAGLLLVAIYIAAVGPLRGGLRKFSQRLIPALILAAWTEAWVVLATIVAAVLHLTRSHFAEKEDFGNWSHLGSMCLGTPSPSACCFVIVLLLMTVVHILWRWPVTVAPGAMLGVFVIMRFWTEAMGLEPLRTAAWSSTGWCW